MPIFWSALALAAPVVIFYLIRERPLKRKLSTLLFWDAVRTRIYQTPLWRRIRRWISLLLQLLFLALLVFALARPVAEWESGVGRRQIFVLDPSASMRAEDVAPSRFANGVEVLRDAVRRMRFFDESAVVLASDPPQILSGWTRSRSRLAQAIDRAEPLGAGGDIRPALRVAQNLAANRENVEIRLISDGVWMEPADDRLLERLTGRWIGGEATNLGITAFAARPSVAGESVLLIRLDASGKEAVEGVLELSRDGMLIDAKKVSVIPGESWEETRSLTGQESGRYEARIIPSGEDVLEVDNRAELNLEPREILDVTLVSPPNGFLESAFLSISGVRVTRMWPPESVGSGDPEKLFIFSEATPPGNFAYRALVLLAPRDSGFWGRFAGEVENPLVSDVERESDVLRFASLEKVQAGVAMEFVPPEGAKVFAGSLGVPLIYGKWSGDAHWLVVAFDLSKGDFVLRTAFPILMANIVQTLRIGNPDGVSAPLAGLQETRLHAAEPLPDDGGRREAGWTAWLARPLWWWAVLAGFVWVLAEWWTYHRRITE